jgi:hypothetical protein
MQRQRIAGRLGHAPQPRCRDNFDGDYVCEVWSKQA